jgi:hypothetical protein
VIVLVFGLSGKYLFSLRGEENKQQKICVVNLNGRVTSFNHLLFNLLQTLAASNC